MYNGKVGKYIRQCGTFLIQQKNKTFITSSDKSNSVIMNAGAYNKKK